jgi:hypothetical protein
MRGVNVFGKYPGVDFGTNTQTGFFDLVKIGLIC